jgi:hypothetical protein
MFPTLLFLLLLVFMIIAYDTHHNRSNPSKGSSPSRLTREAAVAARVDVPDVLGHRVLVAVRYAPIQVTVHRRHHLKGQGTKAADVRRHTEVLLDTRRRSADNGHWLLSRQTRWLGAPYSQLHPLRRMTGPPLQSMILAAGMRFTATIDVP